MSDALDVELARELLRVQDMMRVKEKGCTTAAMHLARRYRDEKNDHAAYRRIKNIVDSYRKKNKKDKW